MVKRTNTFEINNMCTRICEMHDKQQEHSHSLVHIKNIKFCLNIKCSSLNYDICIVVFNNKGKRNVIKLSAVLMDRL